VSIGAAAAATVCCAEALAHPAIAIAAVPRAAVPMKFRRLEFSSAWSDFVSCMVDPFS
jgi:hypothetical protein